jgi:quercetin dioxygenase-like cupin family protein
MKGKFLQKDALEITETPWGPMRWISRPSTTKAKDIVCTIVDIGVGGFHDFHFHPGQEEVIYLLKGKVEQWIEGEKKLLTAGDAVFLSAGVVHASFNVGKVTAQLFVVVSPCRGKAGYRAVDVSQKAPWKGMRKP